MPAARDRPRTIALECRAERLDETLRELVLRSRRASRCIATRAWCVRGEIRESLRRRAFEIRPLLFAVHLLLRLLLALFRQRMQMQERPNERSGDKIEHGEPCRHQVVDRV